MSIRTISLLCCLFCSVSFAWNDGLADDPNVIALYRFENGALTVDSSGNGNTLTPVNTPDANTVDYKEGAASGNFIRASEEAYTVTDGNLSVKFPYKNGQTSQPFSVTCWARLIKDDTDPFWIAHKDSLHVGTKGWGLYFNGAAKNAKLAIDTNPLGGSGLVCNWPTGADEYKWYFVAVMVDEVGTLITTYMHVWDQDAGTSLGGSLDQTGTQDDANTLTGNTMQFSVGAATANPFLYEYNGQIDELVIWDYAISMDDVNDLKIGEYGGGGGQIMPVVFN
ncbi:MAG: hypothetical protein JRC86_05280 [Deltaproteobacteria bacterium]|nr:hypothetical protein [Deltaproteobacteria bacterium]